MKNKGLLITFEGSEGCGKSTHIRRLAAHLKSLKKPILLVREPGGTRIGERIRHLLKFSKFAGNMTSETELLLFSASRAQLVREKIQPSLKGGHIVLCDRFFDSTTVYQGMGRKLDPSFIARLNHFVSSGRKPDLTLLLDVDPGTGLSRARKKTRTADRMEAQKYSFYQKVRHGFLQLARREPQRIKVIPVQESIPVVAEKIWFHVEKLMNSIPS